MDRLFRIDFYPQEWIIDTARLPPDERGVFIQIVCLIYSNRGPIENDAQWIAGVSGCTARLARSIIDKLIAKDFLRLTGEGKITQKRAENELKSKREHLEISSKGGRTKAENSVKHQRNDRETSANAPRNDGESDSELSENNNLNPTDHQNPVATPTGTGTGTPTATATAKGTKKDRESNASPRKVGSRLPDDWQPGDDFINFALQEGMTIEKAQREAGFFRDYWISKPGQHGVKLDWLATWRNWIRREIDRGGGSSRGKAMPNGKPDYFGDLMTAAQGAAQNVKGIDK